MEISFSAGKDNKYLSAFCFRKLKLGSMNYIKHLNAFFTTIRNDNRLTTSHISLYLALFQYWNYNRFQNPFIVYRENIMQLSKIGSRNTYHKCIRELHLARYIAYHPAPTKFLPVKISILPLHNNENDDNNTSVQLDIFGIKNESGNIPELNKDSIDLDTVPVPKERQNIKPNSIKQRETPAHTIFNRNKKIQEAVNNLAQDTNPVPQLKEIESYFAEKKYTPAEARKFFHHYKAIGWKIQGHTPIEDWKALVEKWMENAKHWPAALQQEHSPKTGNEINNLYKSYCSGEKVFSYITSEHFDQLNLTLAEETILQARTERISQLSGSNQYSLSQLWQAYLTNDPGNQLVINDNSNIITFAKRITVIKHFHQLRQSGKTTLD